MESKEKTLKTITTISSVAYIISKIIFVLVCIGAGLGLLGMIISPFIDWSWVQSSIQKGADSLGETWNWINKVNLVNAEVSCAYSLSNGVVAAFLSYFCYSLFKNIKVKKTPFDKENSSYLTKIGVISLIQAFGVPLFMLIITASTKTSDVFSSKVSGASLVLALFIFTLSLIFKYGSSLQEEADTTL